MVDGGGSCCIARRAASDYHPSKAHRIMLKFRPIAPKPAVNGGAHVTHETSAAAVMGRKRRRYRSRIKEQMNKREPAAVTTLPLLPAPAPAVKMQAVGSVVTVESLTDTWVVEYGLGYSDGERMGRLNDDTCPGFVSDGFGRVVWTNGAYREMVRGGDHDQEVSLIVKEEEDRRVLMGCGAAFTCRVRVQYYGCSSSSRSMTIPCDAWRMDGGGFAWRLDMKAALRL